MLVITADDYGYAPVYDEGILQAVRAQAVDGVGAMVLRRPAAADLVVQCARSEVDIGLHLERPAEVPVAEQLREFERLFGGRPGYIDGHHHCHAAASETTDEVGRAAAALGIPVRAVDAGHRERLRGLGVPTADRLVGRMGEGQPVIPPEVGEFLAGRAPDGVTEWMVHPGRAGGPSSYDAGREEDLAELLRLGDRARWRERGALRAPPSRAFRKR